MAIYDKASLVLIPSGTKTSKVYSQKPTNGDGDFTFSRSTAATRVNASGNIEKETENLLLQSNNFGTTWTNSRTTETSGQSGYDGTNNAWLLESTATAQSASIFQVIVKSYVHTFSVYAKAGTSNWMALFTSGNQQAYFDLANGVLGNTNGSDVIDSNIESVGGGWYRCSISVNGNDNVYIFIANGNGNATTNSGDNIYIQDAQLEQGLVARNVITTTTTAIYGGITDNVPRLDYTDSSCPALLLEPQRTNLITQSEYVDSWLKYNCTISSNAIASPEGLQNAHKIVENTSLGYHAVYLNNVFTADGTYKTASVFVKAAERTFCAISTRGAFGSSDKTLIFNLTTGEWAVNGSGQNTGLEAEDYGNGWWRIVLNTDTTSAAYDGFIVGAAIDGSTWADAEYTGDGTSGIYVFGAQVEAGSYATSYIPTYGSAVTRNADDCRITGVSSIVSASEYTIFWEGSHIATGDYNSFATIFNNSAVNQSSRFYRNNTDNQIYAAAFISGSSVTLGSGVTAEYAKCAFRVKSGDFALYVNGSLVASSTSTMTPSATLDSISMQYFYSSQSFDQRTQQFMFFNQALTNEELATLTTI